MTEIDKHWEWFLVNGRLFINSTYCYCDKYLLLLENCPFELLLPYVQFLGFFDVIDSSELFCLQDWNVCLNQDYVKHPSNEQRRFNSVPYHLSDEKKKCEKITSHLCRRLSIFHVLFLLCIVFGWPPLRQTTIFSGVRDLFLKTWNNNKDNDNTMTWFS